MYKAPRLTDGAVVHGVYTYSSSHRWVYLWCDLSPQERGALAYTPPAAILTCLTCALAQHRQGFA